MREDVMEDEARKTGAGGAGGGAEAAGAGSAGSGADAAGAGSAAGEPRAEGAADLGTAVSLSATMLGMMLYHDPASAGALPALEWLSSPAAPESWPFAQPEAAACLEAMATSLSDDPEAVHAEFNRLFVGPNRLPAPPWGSVYTDPESVIFGNETLAVRAWMRACGVAMRLPEREPEDHMGLMLMMLAWSVQHVLAREDVEALLEEHLLPWSGRFLELLEASSRQPFYRELAKLAQLTLGAWARQLGLRPAHRRLYR